MKRTLPNRVLYATQILLYLCGPFFVHFADAQATGHFGKKLIVSVNLLNGRLRPFNSFEAEYTIARRTSVFVSYTQLNYGRNDRGAKCRTGSIESEGGDGKFKEFSTLKNGSTTGAYYGIGLRHYFNQIIPAPYGWYVSYFVGFGKANLSDYTVSYEYKAKLTNISSDGIDRPDATSLNGSSKMIVAELPSLGFQKIIKRFICVDLRAGLLTQYCLLPDNLLNAIEHNYYFRANTISYGYGKFSFGLNINLRLGFLLF